MLAYVRGTVQVLKVKAFLLNGHCEKGLKLPAREMRAPNLDRQEVCPNWNYMIGPHAMAIAPS